MQFNQQKQAHNLVPLAHQWQQQPALPPNPPSSSAIFHSTSTLHSRLSQLQHTLTLAKSLERELEMLKMAKNASGSDGVDEFLRCLDERKIGLDEQEMLSVKAADFVAVQLRSFLEGFRVVTDETGPWEEKSAVVRLAEKVKKSERNKRWRKRKRRRVAEAIVKERDRFDEADREADEWRAREIARDIAQQKVEKMKAIAKLKAKEEKKRLESELELVLIVEKLQELRNIRTEKLKKQGHFLPEEDDKFFERVRVAVEEEEREAIAAADTDAAKDAITIAEESRKNIQSHEFDLKDTGSFRGDKETQDQIDQLGSEIDKESSAAANEEPGKQKESHCSTYDSAANLPDEFYHYYYGSSRDMGTLIEVRRMWDSYIRAGGSRIPGHWVHPPPPADEIWASYLVKPK